MNDPADGDKRLVDRCLAEDPTAWVEFVGRFGPFLNSHLSAVAVQRRIPVSAADLDDLAAKVWGLLLERDKRLLRLYRPGASLDAWILGIAVDRLFKLARSRSREDRRLESYRLALLQEELGEPSPAEAAQREERREKLQAAVRKLPSRERFAVSVYYGSGWTYAQIARVLGLPLNNVGSLLRSAQNRLRNFLGNPHDLPL